MEFVGKLIKRIDLREGDSQRGHWRIASYLLETVEMYPKRMAVDVSDGEYAKRIEQFDSLIGKNVKVLFDVDAREWQGKWYNSVRAYGIKEQGDAAADATATVAEGAHGQTQGNPAADAAGTVANGRDGLPF